MRRRAPSKHDSCDARAIHRQSANGPSPAMPVPLVSSSMPRPPDRPPAIELTCRSKRSIQLRPERQTSDPVGRACPEVGSGPALALHLSLELGLSVALAQREGRKEARQRDGRAAFSRCSSETCGRISVAHRCLVTLSPSSLPLLSATFPQASLVHACILL